MVRPLIILERALARSVHPTGQPITENGPGKDRLRVLRALDRRFPGKLWSSVESIRRHLMQLPLTSDLIPLAVKKSIPQIRDRDLRIVSESLWFSSQDEAVIRQLLQRLNKGGIRADSPFWHELIAVSAMDSCTLWYLIPFLHVIHHVVMSDSTSDKGDELKRQFRVVTFALDVRLIKSFLANLLDEYRLAQVAMHLAPPERKQSRKRVTAIVPIPATETQVAESAAQVPDSGPEPVLDFVPEPNPDAPPEAVEASDPEPTPEPGPDPVLAWILRMNSSRYDHLLDRIHRLADAWRQDVEPRESLLEPMAAVVLNLEKFLRTGGLRPRYPVGKHLTLGLEESADFEYSGAPFDGTPKQVVVTRPGWNWNGEPIGRPTVVEAPAVVPTP